MAKTQRVPRPQFRTPDPAQKTTRTSNSQGSVTAEPTYPSSATLPHLPPSELKNVTCSVCEVIAELIELSKEIVAEGNRGEQFSPPLSNDELAFYDVMATNGSAGEALEDDVLAQIARELVTALRSDAKTDWTVRDDVRAKLRHSIRTLLRRHKYPPEKRNEAVVLVLEQMERFAPRWSEAA